MFLRLMTGNAFLLLVVLLLSVFSLSAQEKNRSFSVLAFYTGKHDAAHISFVEEANTWFAARGT
ncbi:MAG: hypothetical protein WBP58_12620, partial [Chitinophagaceae bacterium]